MLKGTLLNKFKLSQGNKLLRGGLLSVLAASMIIAGAGCSAGSDGGAQEGSKVVIYTNGDEEAVTAMENSLKKAGYEDQYIVQTFGTSELGGKLMAEGKNIEADLVTMSSYFVNSAQTKHTMFKDLAFTTGAVDTYPAYYTPILAITGSIFVNTEVLKEKGLAAPVSIKDLTKPEYKDLVAIPDIMHSSTGWLLVQAVMNEYGAEEGKNVLHALIANVGPHLESSGSGPIKKVEAGEVAAGFGLRHQAVRAKADGAPIDFIDPQEGNFSLTESIAVVDKNNETTDKAMKMAETIIKNARTELLTNYPVALYEGETVDAINQPAKSLKFPQPLTVELLEEHQQFFNGAK